MAPAKAKLLCLTLLVTAVSCSPSPAHQPPSFPPGAGSTPTVSQADKITKELGLGVDTSTPQDQTQAHIWYFQSPLLVDPASCSINIPQNKIIRIDCFTNATFSRQLGMGYSTKLVVESPNSDWPSKVQVKLDGKEVVIEKDEPSYTRYTFYFSESHKAKTPAPVIDRDWIWTVESSKHPRPNIPATLVATTFTLQSDNQWTRLDCWDAPGKLRDKAVKLAQKLGFYKAISNVYENRH